MYSYQEIEDAVVQVNPHDSEGLGVTQDDLWQAARDWADYQVPLSREYHEGDEVAEAVGRASFVRAFLGGLSLAKKQHKPETY